MRLRDLSLIHSLLESNLLHEGYDYVGRGQNPPIDNAKNLTPAQERLLGYYQSVDYRVYNKILRGERMRHGEYVNYIRPATARARPVAFRKRREFSTDSFAKMTEAGGRQIMKIIQQSVVTNNFIAYRGTGPEEFNLTVTPATTMSDRAQYERLVGKTITQPGFLSASKSIGAASDFAFDQNKHPAIVRLLVPKGSHGYYTKSLEYEIIFYPGASLTVNSVQWLPDQDVAEYLHEGQAPSIWDTFPPVDELFDDMDIVEYTELIERIMAKMYTKVDTYMTVQQSLNDVRRWNPTIITATLQTPQF